MHDRFAGFGGEYFHDCENIEGIVGASLIQKAPKNRGRISQDGNQDMAVFTSDIHGNST